ncbi:ANKRD50 [Symbiodinium sp. CCMP2592]|nr:ANKRD50 [Symbiodinium sp. CCMP2592]
MADAVGTDEADDRSWSSWSSAFEPQQPEPPIPSVKKRKQKKTRKAGKASRKRHKARRVSPAPDSDSSAIEARTEVLQEVGARQPTVSATASSGELRLPLDGDTATEDLRDIDSQSAGTYTVEDHTEAVMHHARSGRLRAETALGTWSENMRKSAFDVSVYARGCVRAEAPKRLTESRRAGARFQLRAECVTRGCFPGQWDRAETVIADATGNQDRGERELLRLFPRQCLSCVPVVPVQPPLPPPSTPAPIAPAVHVPQQQTTWNRQPWRGGGQQKQGQWNKRWNQWRRSSQGSFEPRGSGRQSSWTDPDHHNIQEATPSEVAAADARRAAKEVDQDEADDEASYLAALWKSAEDQAIAEKFPDTAAYKEFLEGLEGPIPASVISRVATVLAAFRAYGRPLEGENPVAGVVGPDAHIFRVPGQRILILSCELRGPSYIRNPNSEHSAIMAHGTSFPSLVGVAEIGEIAVNDYRDQGIPCFGFSARGSLVGLSRDALESAATKCASRAKALGGAIILVECELPRGTPSVEGGNEMMQICCRDAGSAYRRVLTLLHAFSSFFDLCTLMADVEEDGPDSVQAVLAGKSPNTILKHVGPVRTFCEWLLKASHTPPFVETVLWSFIHCVLKMPKTAATTLDSSLRAIKWSYYTLGLRVQLEVFSSPRVHGVVKKALQTKNPWCPASPLKVSEVLQLHAICCDRDISVIDRCGAAHFLAMLYARARASDIRCVKSILIDVHNEDWSSRFIELGTLEHKTSRLDTQRRRVLPLVIPGQGIAKTPFGQLLLDIRAEAGLPNDQADVPFLQAPLPDGSWSSDPLSSSEITRWLRYLLPRPSTEQAVSSHSLKVTSLVWCSKFGMLRETKRVLGHHADAATGSDAVYGRELQSAALREYVVVLDAVATGKFLPDQTRSGHFSSGWTRESILQAAAFPQDSEVLQAAVEDDQDEALAVVSDVSDSDEEAPEEQSFWAHPTSQVLHRTTLGSAMFLCGRAVGDHYRRIPMARAQAHPQCAKCFPRYLAMTSSVDSAPFFVQRADEISLAKRVVDALKGKGVTTLAQLAFCVGQPGQVLSQTEFDTWTEAMLVGITVGEKASLRRLILEAQTMLVASLKDLAEPAEHASPKKVGVAERNARMDQLRTQLAGVSLTGQLEPSHALLDMAVQQWESRCLKYIGPEKCHSREDEVQNVKPLTTSLSLEGGKLKVTEAAGMDDRDIEGSLQVLNALRRRGVAYAFARLICWERHEAYVSSLFRYLTKPAQPGYRKVSLRQILRADKLAFSKLSEAGEDIRADASGTLPLDAAIGAILHDYDLIVALLPMGDLDGKGKNANGRGGRPGPYSDNAPWKGKNGKGKGGWNSKGSDSWTGKGKNTWQAKGKSPKGKGSGAGKPEWLPEGLRFQAAPPPCTAALASDVEMTPSEEPVSGAISVADVTASASPPVGVGVDPASEMVDVDDSPIFVEPTVLDPPTMPSTSSELERTGSEGALPSPPVASEDFSPAPPTQEPARAVLQCFAGQARVASALIKQGYFSYGVDRFKQKAAMAPVLQMDLSTREACDSVLTWLDNRKIAGVMICIPKHASEPVTTAFVLAVMAGCLSNNLPMVLEGSVSSPFWESFNRLPSAQHPPHRVEVDWQLWDSHSKQRSLVWSNLPEILTVRREAAPMGHKVQQRSEAQTGYPPAFATAIAEVFIAGLTQRQLPCRSPALANKSLRVSAMNQPRGAMPEVVSEWKLVVYVLLPPQVEDPFGGSKRLKRDWRVPHGARVLPELKLLPQDSQLLSRTQSGGQLSPQLQQEMQNLNGASVLRVGIPWDPIEFIAKAGKIGHPYHKLSKCNKDLRDLVHDLVHKPGPVRSQRKNYIEKWARRAKELEPEETKLKAGMSDHRRKILQPKRILLFEEMLRDIGYDDMGVVQELIDGATLTGDIPITGVLDTKLKPARLDTEQLIGMSDEIRQQIRVKTGSSGDKEIDQLLWDKTMEEVQSGYLSGPYDFESLPKRCLVSSRFPLLQGEKLRPIDNYSSSLINDTVTVSEKPITHSIDEIALLINTLSSAARKKNLNALYGKTADLKGAYRQLAVSDTSLDFSYLSVYDPAEEKPKLFQQLAVPFGSTKAVYFFLRVARALWTILVKGARIPTTNYFDDFVLLALGGDRSSCSHAFDEVMRLLGWKLSADKTTEWNTSFEALGVLFELDQTGSGVLKVRNTEKRRKELTAAIKGFLDKGTMTQKEALQLRGRLQFAQAQFFGRLGRRCLTEVTKHAYTGRSKLSSIAKERLEEFGKFLDMAQPRLVGQVSCRTFMILTDAAFETESGTGGLGGVLLTGSGSALSFFSVPISEQQAKSMSLQDEHTIIYELEMFGVLIGLKLLVEKTAAFAESYEQPGAVAGTGVICYIDNDAARHAYIAGSSKKEVAGILIDEVNFLEYVHGILPWYARVASPANLADEPSRMKLDRVKRLGFKDESVEATKAVLSIVKRVHLPLGEADVPEDALQDFKSMLENESDAEDAGQQPPPPSGPDNAPAAVLAAPIGLDNAPAAVSDSGNQVAVEGPANVKKEEESDSDRGGLHQACFQEGAPIQDQGQGRAGGRHSSIFTSCFVFFSDFSALSGLILQPRTRFAVA